MNPIRFRIPINKKQWLSVTVWPTHEAFVSGTQHYFYGRQRFHRSRIAIYATFKDRKKRSGEWARMFFSLENLERDVVAHEIQHFIFDWLMYKLYKVGSRHDEQLAYLVQDVTAAFWKKCDRAISLVPKNNFANFRKDAIC